MKFTTPSKVLISTMKDVVGIIPATSTLPILHCVHISSDSSEVKIRSTNLEIDIVVTLLGALPGTLEAGECCVDGRKLMEILGNISGDVTLTHTKKSQLLIEYKNGKMSLATLDPLEFPKRDYKDSGKTITITGTSLKQAYDLVKNNISKDNSRTVLQSISFIVEKDHISLSATNGYSLAVSRIENQYDGEKINPVVVVDKFFGVINNTPERVNIGIGDGYIYYKDSWKEVYSSLVAGTFPDASAVIPKKTKFGIVINTSELASALKRSTSIAEKGINLIGIKFLDDSIEITAEEQEVGDFSEKVGCVYVEDTHTFDEIHFSATYLLGIINPLASRGVEKIEVFFVGETNPAKIDAPNFIGVVMPMHKR